MNEQEIAKEASACYQSILTTCDRYNVLHPNARISPSGILFDLRETYYEQGNTEQYKIYRRALDLAIYDNAFPVRRSIADMDAEIAAAGPDMGIGLV